MKLLGYSKVCCPKCQKLMVEVWKVGNKKYNICGICHWCIELNDYLDVDKMLNDMRGEE